MRPAVPLCDHCRRAIRERERCDLYLPARKGEPAMLVRNGACVKCTAPEDERSREDAA
jgi:hypothetical protein